MEATTTRVKEAVSVVNGPIESLRAIKSGAGESILVAGRDRRAYIVDLARDLHNDVSRIMKSYEDVHTKRVTDVEYSVDGDKVITVSADGCLVFWDRESKEFQKFEGHEKNITSVALNAKGNKIVTGSEDNTFILWNSFGEKKVVFRPSMEQAHKSWINSVGFLPDESDTLVTASEDGTVKMWNLDEKKPFKTFFKGAIVNFDTAKDNKSPVCDMTYAHGVKAVAFSKIGSLFAYGGRDGKVYIMDPAESESLQTISVSDTIYALAYGETQPLLAISVPKKIIFWNLIENKMEADYVFSSNKERYCESMVFVGEELVAGLDDGQLIRIEISKN